MFHNKIKDGAFFIADAHESEVKRRVFGKFLDEIYSGKLKPTQLFLMGDIFDVLIGTDKFCTLLWDSYIKKIDEIAKNIEVFYFEGNHDFDLQRIFSYVKVIPLQSQPSLFICNDKKFLLSHGDSFDKFSYKIYTKFIRSKITISLLNIFQKLSNCKITRDLSKKLEKKNICTKMSSFEKIVEEKMDKYKDCDYVVEGHYHQNVSFTFKNKTYINLASFACENIYYSFTYKEKIEFNPIVFN
ncbi:MAG: UDP-2,3-diacylglucosamine diphosphatase [Campylobacteraceae bacterium]|jgi:UDP-2,3-diacylglucosamine hydrolase|nr:UDP-2,3-diacylglucosamine diphosphatase [Campylobacteraceae bacterium]